jgi:PAS domain S-box-containing protein
MWFSSPNSRRSGFLVVVCLLLSTALVSYLWARRYSKHERLVIHTYRVLDLLTKVSDGLSRVENERRGYILSDDRTMLLELKENVSSIKANVALLGQLTTDNLRQQQSFVRLEPLVEAQLAFVQQAIDLQDQNPGVSEQQVDLMRQSVGIDDQIQLLLMSMRDEENRLLHQRTEESQAFQRRFTLMLVLSFVLAALILTTLFVMMSSEVSRRAGAEEVALENEERFRMLVSGIQDYAIVRLDDDGKITSWNQGAERVFGYLSEEIIGKSLSHLFDKCDRDTPARHLTSALRDGQIEDDCQQIRKDGALFWAKVSLTHLRNAVGQSRGYALIIRDISERRRQQDEILQRDKLLDAFFSNAPVGLAIIDHDLHFQRINGPFSKLNGLTPEENKGQHVRDVTSELATELEPLIRRVINTGVPVMNREIKGHAPAAPETLGWWSKSFFPISQSEGVVTQVGAIVQDITTLKRAENTVRWLSGRLLQLRDDERRRLARDLHDSLGQTLSAVKMNLSYLGRDTSRLDDRGRNAVVESKDLIDGCIKEVRTLSHLLHPPMLDEMGLLPAIRWFVNGFSQRSGVEVALDLPAVLRRLPVEAETAAFRAIQESLTNVHRHSGSPTARVSLNVVDSSLVLEIADDGSGIPAQKLAARQEGANIGVGILGMRERIRQLGGDLDISSTGHGTSVQVIIPFTEASS